MILISTPAFIILVIWCLGFAASVLMKRSPEVLCFWVFAGILFLPQFRLDVPLLWPNKVKLIALCATLAAVVSAPKLGVSRRIRLLDLPAFILPLAALGASVSNGLGAYDGLTAAVEVSLYWSCPWFVGRFIFGRTSSASLLTRVFILAALIYVPFCLLEMRLSPTLHAFIYGYSPRGGGSLRGESFRFGLWRPTVFMEFGLQLSLFMGAASVAAFWGWITGKLKPIMNVNLLMVASLLAVTTLMCVSTGAILLTVFGWLIVLAFHMRLPFPAMLLFGLSLVPVVYPVFRMSTPGGISLSQTRVADKDVSARIRSLEVRIQNEELFLTRWRLQPFLGWTARSYFVPGVQVIPDSMWIQILCKFGLLGWGAFVLMQVSPLWSRLFNRRKKRDYEDVSMLFSLLSIIFAFDCLANAMELPVYGFFAGAAMTLSWSRLDADESASGVEEHARRSVVQRQAWPRPAVVGIGAEE